MRSTAILKQANPAHRRANSTRSSINTKVRLHMLPHVYILHLKTPGFPRNLTWVPSLDTCLPTPATVPSTDSDGDDITIYGTIKLCEDLAVNPEDVVLLAVAFELKSPSMGQWSRKGWTDGWKQLG